MALRTPPSWLQNGSHPAENDRLTAQALWRTSGIVGSTDLQVTQNATPGMTVYVTSGWAAIVGTTQTNMGTYVAYNDATTTLTITAANATNPRIDIVVVTVSDSYYTGSTNTVAFQVIAGTPAVSPAAPSVPANSLLLANIAVAANATQILNANITNVATQATTPIGLSSSGTYTVNNLTGTTSLTSATVTANTLLTSAGNITQTGTNSVGSLPDSIINLIMGAY
jgi:hypothetical protein